MRNWQVVFSAIATTLIFAAMMFVSYHLGVEASEPKTEVVLQTRLVVPPVCLEALDHGDDIALLLGSAIGSAARGQSGQSENLHPLLTESSQTNERYRRAASRCRQLGETP